jgi:hypothetical protein
MDRIANMIIRRLVNKVVGTGIDKGAEMISARRSPDGQAADITAEQRKQVQRTSRNARQAMRVARRLGRF